MRLNDIIKIGDKIKIYRKQKHISQKKMAEILKIPYSTYSNYENNNRTPTADILKKIADALGITVNDLIKDDTIDITNMNDDEKLSSKTIPELFEEMCDIMCNELCKYADTVDEEGMCEQGRTGGCPLRKFF